MSISELNTFSRCFDLVFIENGRVQGQDVLWFIDYDNKRRCYTEAEIKDKLASNLAGVKV